MLETDAHPERLATAVADGDTLRYYPAFDLPSRAALPPPGPAVREHGAQLLVAQRASGVLTIGDTHEYEEPYDFSLDEAPYLHLLGRAESLLGEPVPPVRRRWAGVYSQAVDGSACVRVAAGGSVVVTGLGGRGMTLAPAIAEETFERWSWR
jgi:glycine/D-amino acid oxidase-like deaminating enzyme